MGLYKKYIGNKLLVKLFLTYSLLILFAVLGVGNIIKNNVTKIIIDNEINNQQQAIQNMKAFTEKKMDNVKATMLELYGFVNENNYIVQELLKQDPSIYSELDGDQKEYLTNLAFSISRRDESILDLIILTKHNKVFTTNSRSSQSRSLSPSYDFSSNPDIQFLQENNGSFYMLSDIHTHYIIGRTMPVISVMGHLYDENQIDQKQSIGKYIINLSTQVFMETYTTYTNNKKGTLYITDNQGTVFFSTHENEIGGSYNYYRDIMDMDDTEIMLEELSVVNKVQLSGYNMSIFMTTPKSEITKGADVIQEQIISIMVLSIVVAMVLTLLASRGIYANIKELLISMDKVRKGDLMWRTHIKSQDEIGQLGTAFNSMCEKLNAYINKVYKAEIETKSAQLAELQSTINPHFLNNTLELIRIKAMDEEAVETSDMLSILGKIFMWNLKTKTKVIRVEDEIDYLQSYTRLLTICSDYELEIMYQIDDNIRDMAIPIQSIQPLIENALYHGLSTHNYDGQITIRGYIDGGDMHITVWDDGVGMDATQLDSVVRSLDEEIRKKSEYHIGLSNVHQRIKLIYGQEYGIHINSEKGNGTLVTMKLPLVTMEDTSYV